MPNGQNGHKYFVHEFRIYLLPKVLQSNEIKAQQMGQSKTIWLWFTLTSTYEFLLLTDYNEN